MAYNNGSVKLTTEVHFQQLNLIKRQTLANLRACADDKAHKFTDSKLIEKYQNDGYGIYFVVNNGGNKDADITECTALFAEYDDIPKDEQLAKYRDLMPTPTLMVDTGGKSIHAYWVFTEPISPEVWKPLQKRLLDYLECDRTIKNPSRIMRLAGTKHQKTGNYSQIIEVNETALYEPQDFEKYFSQPDKIETIPNTPPTAMKNILPIGNKFKSSRWEQYLEDFEFRSEPIDLIDAIAPSHRDLIYSGVARGSRDDRATAIARDLIGTAKYLDSVNQAYNGSPHALLEDFCNRCTPPLNGSDGDKTPQEVYGYALNANPDPCLDDYKIKAKVAGIFWKTDKGNNKVVPINLRDKSNKSDEFKSKNNWLLDAIDDLFYGHWISVNGSLYQYNDKFYELKEDVLIRRKINSWCSEYVDSKGNKSKATPTAVKTVFEWAVQRFGVSPNEINQDGLPLANGVLTIKKVGDEIETKLEPHSPDKYFTFCSEVNYNSLIISNPADELLQCLDSPYKQLFIDTLSTILNIKLIRRKWDRIKALICIGEGNNGKDTLRTIVDLILGGKGMTGCSLTDFKLADTGRAFNLHRLVTNPKINWSSENRELPIDGLQSLKQVITGDPIYIEAKGKDGVEVNLNTLFIFNANKAPQIKGNQKAIESRFTLIPFDKVYATHPQHGELKANPRFKHDREFLINEVCPAFLNLLIERFKNVYQHGIDYENTNEFFKQTVLEGNHLKRFCDDVGLTFTSNHDHSVTCGAIWEKLEQWYIDNGFLEIDDTGKKPKKNWLDSGDRNDPIIKASHQIRARFKELFPKALDSKKDNKRGLKGLLFDDRLLILTTQGLEVTPQVTPQVTDRLLSTPQVTPLSKKEIDKNEMDNPESNPSNLESNPSNPSNPESNPESNPSNLESNPSNPESNLSNLESNLEVTQKVTYDDSSTLYAASDIEKASNLSGKSNLQKNEKTKKVTPPIDKNIKSDSFKVGDRVQFVHKASSLNGKTGVLIDIRGDECTIYRDDDGSNLYTQSRCLRLIE